MVCGKISTAASWRGIGRASQHSAEFLLVVGPESISGPGLLPLLLLLLPSLLIYRSLAAGAETNAISLLLMAWPVRCQCPASGVFSLESWDLFTPSLYSSSLPFSALLFLFVIYYTFVSLVPISPQFKK